MWPLESRCASASRRSFDPNTIGSGPGARSRRSSSASTHASDLAATSTVSPRARASHAIATTVCDLPVPGAPESTVIGSVRLDLTAACCAPVSTNGDSTSFDEVSGVAATVRGGSPTYIEWKADHLAMGPSAQLRNDPARLVTSTPWVAYTP